MLSPLMTPLINALNSNHPSVMTASLRCILRLLKPCPRGEEVGADSLAGVVGKDDETGKTGMSEGSALKKTSSSPCCRYARARGYPFFPNVILSFDNKAKHLLQGHNKIKIKIKV